MYPNLLQQSPSGKAIPTSTISDRRAISDVLLGAGSQWSMFRCHLAGSDLVQSHLVQSHLVQSHLVQSHLGALLLSIFPSFATHLLK